MQNVQISVQAYSIEVDKLREKDDLLAVTRYLKDTDKSKAQPFLNGSDILQYWLLSFAKETEVFQVSRVEEYRPLAKSEEDGFQGLSLIIIAPEEAGYTDLDSALARMRSLDNALKDAYPYPCLNTPTLDQAYPQKVMGRSSRSFLTAARGLLSFGKPKVPKAPHP